MIEFSTDGFFVIVKFISKLNILVLVINFLKFILVNIFK